MWLKVESTGLLTYFQILFQVLPWNCLGTGQILHETFLACLCGDLVYLCLRVAKAPELEHQQIHEAGAVSGFPMVWPRVAGSGAENTLKTYTLGFRSSTAESGMWVGSSSLCFSKPF